MTTPPPDRCSTSRTDATLGCVEPLLEALQAAFLANPVVNGAILAVLFFGLILDVVQVTYLRPAAYWVDQTSRGFATRDPPRLVAAPARVLAGREREGVTLSMFAIGSMLDSVRARLRDARELPRQLVGLLILLGLLGGFWALSGSSAPGAEATVFLGVAAAVILGLANALTGMAQDRFFYQLEEFLAQRAQLPSSLLGGEATLPAYLEALLRQTAENLGEIQRIMIRTEDERRATQAALGSLGERLAELSDQLRAEQKVILTLTRDHNELQPAMAELATQVAGAVAASEEMREHMRSLDVAVARLLDEVSTAREQAPEAMRQEIKILAQTLAPTMRPRA